jgi:hypothetical protein
MNRLIDIRFGILLLLTLLVVGCGDKDTPAFMPSNSVFVMYIQLPESEAITRGEGDSKDIFADKAYESSVKTIDVWVFPSGSTSQIDLGDGTKKDYLYEHMGQTSLSQRLTTVSFKVADSFISNNEGLKLDIYVVINAASVGLSWDDNGTTTKSALEALSFSGSYFDINTLTSIDDFIVEKGLPMSGYLKNADIITEEGQYTTEHVMIKRAVSKLRFVLAKAPGMDNAKIHSISLSGGKIPVSEYVFSGTLAENGADLHNDWTGTDYVTNGYEWSGMSSVAIPEHQDPASLKWSSADYTPQSWEDAINDAIADKTALEYTRAYLRESPLKLTGSISYEVVNGETKTANFSMANEGDFLRNHSWTVYIYLYQNGLVFEVAKWDTESHSFKPFI